jgi:hypothetical protein
MRVAISLAARPLVINGRSDIQAAMSVRRCDDAHTVARRGLLGSGPCLQRGPQVGTRELMAYLAIAGPDHARFVRVGGESELAFAVEHADAVDALLFGDGPHNLVGRSAIVGQHGVPGGAGDTFGELVGAENHGAQKLALLGALNNVSGECGDQYDDDRERDAQFERQPARHPTTL